MGDRRGKKSSGRKDVPAQRVADDSALLQKIALSQERWQTFRYVIVGLIICGAIAAITLPAKALAGQDTNVNVNVALGLTIAFSIVGGGAWIWGYRQKQKFQGADLSKRELEGRLRLKTEELAAANRRIEELEADRDPLPRERRRR